MTEYQGEAQPILSISCRGQVLEMTLDEHITVSQVKSAIVDDPRFAVNEDKNVYKIKPEEIKLLWKGKVLQDNDESLYKLFYRNTDKSNKVSVGKKVPTFKLIAMGVSKDQAESLNREIELGKHRTRLDIRDDLSTKGQQDLKKRAQLGKMTINKVRSHYNKTQTKYGFGTIETIPNLPNEDQARYILQTLANDPGVLACMAKHHWNVGSLAELYPDGKVGQSEVCVMGLNTNKGQKIHLRIRTDDLKGFRKILSIRKVLFHELAHNVYSEHDNNFFQLMRQVEKECNEMDWTNGAGLSHDNSGNDQLYSAGVYRLGGSKNGKDDQPLTSQQRREYAARAAEMRMTDAEMEEIQAGCGCSKNNKFLPVSMNESPTDNRDFVHKKPTPKDRA